MNHTKEELIQFLNSLTSKDLIDIINIYLYHEYSCTDLRNTVEEFAYPEKENN